MSDAAYAAPWQTVHDVIVVGTGLAGFAASQALAAAGHRVLLLDHRGRGDLLYECSRAFCTDLTPHADPAWTTWLNQLRAAGAAGAHRLDGALAEIHATHWLREQRLPVLYYAIPVAAERDADGNLASLIVATKGGLRRLRARRWLDATHAGLLASLLGPPPTLATSAWQATVHLHAAPATPASWQGTAGDLQLALLPGLWPAEWLLQVRWQDGSADWWQRLAPALQALHAARPEIAQHAVVSHLSAEPLATTTLHLAADLPANIVTAGVGQPLATLADRFASGSAAAAALAAAPRAAVAATADAPIPALHPAETLTADVLVAGAGTGGALAAIAAGRAGARTLCFDPLPFAGGIGTGGGIHSYYYGLPGGLQDEVDDRVQAAMALFAGNRKQVRGFHPDAKKLVLHALLREAGVTFLPGTSLVAATTRDGLVTTVTAAQPGRPLALRASSYIDATGDGDLAAAAGATAILGRTGDGLLHAYSQSSGRLHALDDGHLAMAVVNFDAGWVDPTDSADLTRARLAGIDQYWQPTFSADGRPTYIAPAIGLRQGPQFITDYQLTLADLLEQRHFPDAVGRTSAHYDNHAVDYEFESDEALFWVWGCAGWRVRTHCDLPYRIMLPRGLRNVWLACRGAGVSADAHHSMRMQRDIQRLGEVAGLAAALAARTGTDARTLSWPTLAESLLASGACSPRQIPDRYQFGVVQDLTDSLLTAPAPITPEQVAAGLADVRRGQRGLGLWHLYRAQLLPAELAGLLAAADPDVSWCAAIVLALRGEASAEPRLLHALATLEDARDHGLPPGWLPPSVIVPRWLAALGLLRCCGTPAAAPVLDAFLQQPNLALNALTTAATTLDHLLRTHPASTAWRPALERLLAVPAAEYPLNPQHPPHLHGEPPHNPTTAEPHGWQLALVQARLARAAGRDPAPWLTAGLADPRALVRRQFAALLA